MRESVRAAQQALAEGRFCKIICGLGMSDALVARRMATLYALAGADALDVAADPDVVAAARAGFDDADRIAGLEGRILVAPALLISVGLQSDPHVGRALLHRSICATCAGCSIPSLRLCAERPLELRAPECPGCMACIGACPYGAITVAAAFDGRGDGVATALAAGADGLELHVGGAAVADIEQVMTTLMGLIDEGMLLSFSVGSEVTSTALVLDQVRWIEAQSHEPTVIQVEGRPMSGGADIGRAGPAAAAAIELAARVTTVVQRTYVQIAGGADHTTHGLCVAAGLACHGIGFGGTARLAARQVLHAASVDPKDPVFCEALAAARALVESCHRGTG